MVEACRVSEASRRAASRISVVVPVHRPGAALERCLEAITGADPAAGSVVVVLDGPDTGARDTVTRYRVRVIQAPARVGPAGARNLGAEETTADTVLFVDSDVVVPPDLIGRIGAVMEERPEIAAVFGSYDDRAPADGFVPQFKNLLHHFVHQHSSPGASTFWTGCGAIRRAVFMSVGGFDTEQRWLEDVELGYRLRAAGHLIHLDRKLQVSHLKRWSFGGLVLSDIAHRAWPWTELIHRYRALPDDLNLSLRGRVSAAGLVALLAALVATPWWRGAWYVAAAALLVVFSSSAPLYRFFLRRRGALFALRAIPMHWLYLLYSAATFALGTAWWSARRLAAPFRQGESDNERSLSE